MKIDYLSKDIVTEEFGDVNIRSGKAKISDKNKNYIFSLMSKIYSDEIGSIVREITSNCFDAHIKAGKKDEPVIVRLHIDDSDNYFIEFIDKGTGISVEDMDNIYMSYGESDKRDSDEFLGAFGLGSKSPFSKSEYFYLITKVNGVQYTYLLNNTIQGPEYNCLLEEECDFENGTIIRVPIQKNELKDWEEKIVHQLRYFKNVFVLGFDSFNNEYKIKDYNTFQFREDLINNNLLLHLVIGDVAYPINFELLKEEPITFNAALKFNIGELTVTPNREEIKYSLETINLIKSKISEFKKELKTIVFDDKNIIINDFHEVMYKKYLIRQNTFVVNNLLENTDLRLNISGLSFLNVNEKILKLKLGNEIYNLDYLKINSLFKKHIRCVLKYSYGQGTLSTKNTSYTFDNMNVFETNQHRRHTHVILNDAKIRRWERAYCNDNRIDRVFTLSQKEIFYKNLYHLILKNNIIDLGKKKNAYQLYADFVDKINYFIYEQLFTSINQFNIDKRYGLSKRKSVKKEDNTILLYKSDYGTYERQEVNVDNIDSFLKTNNITIYSTFNDVGKQSYLSMFLNNIDFRNVKFIYLAKKYHKYLESNKSAYNINEVIDNKINSELFKNQEIIDALKHKIKQGQLLKYYEDNELLFNNDSFTVKCDDSVKEIAKTFKKLFNYIGQTYDKKINSNYGYKIKYVSCNGILDESDFLKLEKQIQRESKDDFKLLKHCNNCYIYFTFFRSFLNHESYRMNKAGIKLTSDYLKKEEKTINKFYKLIVKN